MSTPGLPSCLRGGGAASLLAPAKLTRSLRILGRRDDSFHLLQAEMVRLSLCDTIELCEGDGLEVLDEVAWSGTVPAPVASAGQVEPAVAAVPENLVVRALGYLGRKAQARLVKRIPQGAGLGGGSADAAAVLSWAGGVDLLAAVRLGADVPFCLSGFARAEVSGIGEVVTEMASDPRHLLLVVPRLEVSTPAVYEAWDELGGPTGDFGNDLEPAALVVAGELRWWRDLLAATAGERPRLAGSGGTWFIEGEASVLESLAAEVRAEIVASRESALVMVVASS